MITHDDLAESAIAPIFRMFTIKGIAAFFAISGSNSFSFEVEIDTAGCHA